MRRIAKTISLEQFTSRLPSVVPYFRDGELWYVGNDCTNPMAHIDDRRMANYGGIPFKVKYTDPDTGECIVFSHYNMAKAYHFFKKYYDLINNGYCSRPYRSAVEFFEGEGIVGDKSDYEELDRQFKEYHGKVSSTVTEEKIGGQISAVYYVDEGFYKEICEKYILTFDVPKNYTSSPYLWTSPKMFYPDVNRWHGWFSAVEKKMPNVKSYTDTSKCKTEEECCICKEYILRGGNPFHNLLISWLSKADSVIKANNAAYDAMLDALEPSYSDYNDVCFEHNSCQDLRPYIRIPMYMGQKIEDMGEYSILSEEWEPGIDYLHASGGSDNKGTVVTHDGGLYVLNGSGVGYNYDEKYREMLWGNENYNKLSGTKYQEKKSSHWSEYRDTWIEGVNSAETKTYCENGTKKTHIPPYSGEVPTSITSYTIDVHGLVKYNAAGNPDDISAKYSITKKDIFTINGIDYEVIHGSAVTFDDMSKSANNGKKFLIERNGMRVPTVTVGGKKYVALNDGSGNYSFYFKKNGCELGPKSDISAYDYIVYEENVKQVTGNTITLNTNGFTDTYHKTNGFVYVDGEKFYVSGTSLVKESATATTSSINHTYKEAYNPSWMQASGYPHGYKIANGVLNVLFPYIERSTKTITGETTSKLQDLMLHDVQTDNMGYELSGVFKQHRNTTEINDLSYPYPAEGEVLDLFYQVGNTANVDIISSSTSTTEILTTYSGNIIVKMCFYLTQRGTNEPIAGTSAYTQISTAATYDFTDSDSTYSGCSLSAISKVEDIKKTYFDAEGKATGDTVPNDYIDCMVTYAFGAEFVQKVDKSGDKFTYHPSMDYKGNGVEYQEHVICELSSMTYHMSSQKEYPVLYYNVQQDTKDNVLPDGNTEQVKPCDFSFTIKGIAGDPYPLFKQEYLLGCSSRERVEGDIYVDRGNSTALEKHLKLGECATFEALENYGNHSLKIINPDE